MSAQELKLSEARAHSRLEQIVREFRAMNRMTSALFEDVHDSSITDTEIAGFDRIFANLVDRLEDAQKLLWSVHSAKTNTAAMENVSGN